MESRDLPAPKSHSKLQTELPLLSGQGPKGRILTWDAQPEGDLNLLTEQGPLTI